MGGDDKRNEAETKRQNGGGEDGDEDRHRECGWMYAAYIVG